MRPKQVLSSIAAVALGVIAVLIPLVFGLPRAYWYCDACSRASLSMITFLSLVGVHVALLLMIKHQRRTVGLGILAATLGITTVSYLSYPSSEPWSVVNLVHPLAAPILLAGVSALVVSWVLSKSRLSPR